MIVIRLKTQKNPKNRSSWGACKSLILLNKLVAGVGFEPTTFRLWAWRATGLLHPASCLEKNNCEANRPGNDLLSHTLRCSTISATELHGRVRNGIGWYICAIITRPISLTALKKEDDPNNCLRPCHNNKNNPVSIFMTVTIKPIELLVLVSFTHYCASTPSLSTW